MTHWRAKSMELAEARSVSRDKAAGGQDQDEGGSPSSLRSRYRRLLLKSLWSATGPFGLQLKSILNKFSMRLKRQLVWPCATVASLLCHEYHGAVGALVFWQVHAASGGD
ncbi:hypothetical protein EDD85DRAFT_942532 [Armillaria nabsnona]|nr:hypothetical protein EDD85DRAFT_942532 [Armillaria nabsnona]